MNKEALAKHALKSFVGNQSSSERQRYEQMELQRQQQQAKKWWWSKNQPMDSVLTTEERKLLKKVKSRAHFLDRGLSCCCFQIGFDGLVGLIPVVGDFIGLLLALNLVRLCMRANLPNELVSKMMFNIVFDFLIGLVPVIGDIMDIMYKCNTKNAILFEDYLYKRHKKAGHILGGNHPPIGHRHQ